ncbi:unnamed protein product [Lepeophtheirus salmonis]|uniref:(salmon louse) hypothetical protein n=1 Tax=Lepeophtheirus salmonis TaxID=72036 RepID=A0A7R8CMY3_LEPSM|nr:unnamed protein product [Lepeophtheirus salmonis]CAF2870418.1 unnamed protein product [Lepeophtheirus salmonis]
MPLVTKEIFAGTYADRFNCQVIDSSLSDRPIRDISPFGEVAHDGCGQVFNGYYDVGQELYSQLSAVSTTSGFLSGPCSHINKLQLTLKRSPEEQLRTLTPTLLPNQRDFFYKRRCLM